MGCGQGKGKREVNTTKWTELQVAMAKRIASLPLEEQREEMLKWALSRLSYWGPGDDPCCECLREFVNTGILDPKHFQQ